MNSQCCLFNDFETPRDRGKYLPVLTAVRNGKGVLDVDTVKGCELGMKAYPNGGCYGECYAYKNAHLYGIDFSVSVSRRFIGREHLNTVTRAMNQYDVPWYRVGTAGDPCHDWDNTLTVCNALRHTNKTPVIITKHWIPLSDEHLLRLRKLGAVINTSTSGLDTDKEIKYRVDQINRIRDAGIKSVNRVITCLFGRSEWGRRNKEKQEYLLSLPPLIENPLRATQSNYHVKKGDIVLVKRSQAVGGGKFISLHRPGIYLEKCNGCPDQCGVGIPAVAKSNKEENRMKTQTSLLRQSVEFLYVKSVIGSGYEADVSKLALEDGIAHRAARKNMQIHSAIILEINQEFCGFMTFQNNDIAKEFCLLQSVIRPDEYDDDLYRDMVNAVIAQNVNNYPAIMTTDPKSKFETPRLFESLGFQTYLKMGEFHYMVHGKLEDVRMKLLAHITMTNVWDTVKKDWLRLKREWNEKINEAGIIKGVQNPTYASRDGCWQGSNGFANVVTGHSHNGNASVLDPVACEVILRFFMPKDGRRVYNPFGGGVQFGFIAGSYGYEYIASEIRQNQCDANNLICQDLNSAKWVKSDSGSYEPDGMFDLVFTCPPYYKVEKYIDYDGQPPEGEINSMSTYEQFRDTLFAGYEKALAHLNDNRFFVVMTGDSRDKNGAYYCSEAETELFFKERGIAVYNKITYLECEFTRLAHAKKTLNMRKFPKREQKIIVAYKGSIPSIKDLYATVGRL
ncbi:MAG: hypothetical protein WC294_08165 [Methanoregula sp.]|jgi:hypothetical protein